MRPDCVATYHLNPWTCGIAKWSGALAERLSIPLISCLDLQFSRFTAPLLSLNTAELSGLDQERVAHWLDGQPCYTVFFHGWNRSALDRRLATQAVRVWVGNRELLVGLKEMGIKAEALWCPSPLRAQPVTEPYVLVFGMGHKSQAHGLQKLAALLPSEYQIALSFGAHDETAWGDAFAAAYLRAVGAAPGRVRLLGYLADDALATYLSRAAACALFYSLGVRANNTTFWTALDAGCPVITRIDGLSPPGIIHGDTAFDVDRLAEWPSEDAFAHVTKWGAHLARVHYGWNALLPHFTNDPEPVDDEILPDWCSHADG